MVERALMRTMAVAVVLVLARAGAAQERGNAAWATVANPVPPTEQSISDGRQLYQRYCRACHHASGNGKGPYAIARALPAADFTDDKWDHGSTDGEIFSVIRNGTGVDLEAAASRPASGGPSLVHVYEGRISDREIWSLVNYLRRFRAHGPSGRAHR